MCTCTNTHRKTLIHTHRGEGGSQIEGSGVYFPVLSNAELMRLCELGDTTLLSSQYLTTCRGGCVSWVTQHRCPVSTLQPAGVAVWVGWHNTAVQSVPYNLQGWLCELGDTTPLSSQYLTTCRGGCVSWVTQHRCPVSTLQPAGVAVWVGWHNTAVQSVPYNLQGFVLSALQWQYKPRSSLCRHASQHTDCHDRNFHVLYSWMLATETHTAYNMTWT